MCERQGRSEKERGREWEKKKKNCRWKKSQNWHLNFYWRFVVCSPNKLTAAKGPSTSPIPLCPFWHSAVNHRASTKAVQTARKPVLDSAAHKCWWMLILLLLLLGKQTPHESVSEIYSWVELFFMARRAAGGVACFAIDLILNCAQCVRIQAKSMGSAMNQSCSQEREPAVDVDSRDWGAEKGLQKGIGRQLKAHNSCLKWKGQLCGVFFWLVPAKGAGRIIKL